MDLPDSIISDILSRLLVDDIARCRCVCKRWNDLTVEDHFSFLHCYKSMETYQPGDIDILLSDHSKSVPRYFENPIGDSLYFISTRRAGHWTIIKAPPPPDHGIVKREVQGSCNGLLCLTTRSHSCPDLIYNPITKNRITLPVLDFHPQREGGYKCGFGFDRINMKYKVVVTYYWKSYIDDKSFFLRMTGAILTLGESSWRPLQIPVDVDQAIYFRDPLFFNGVFWWAIATEFHWECSSNPRVVFDGLLTLDIGTEKFKIIKFSPSLELPRCLDLIQLGNSVGLVADKERSARGFISDATRFGPPSLEIWEILGANTDGSCRYKYMTFNVHVDTNPFIGRTPFKLLCALGNSGFLFYATVDGPKDERGYYGSCDHLVIYDPEKDEGSIVEIAGIPKSFYPNIVSPSFISPTM